MRSVRHALINRGVGHNDYLMRRDGWNVRDRLRDEFSVERIGGIKRRIFQEAREPSRFYPSRFSQFLSSVVLFCGSAPLLPPRVKRPERVTRLNVTSVIMREEMVRSSSLLYMTQDS